MSVVLVSRLLISRLLFIICICAENATVFVDFTKKSDLTPSIKILEMEINMN